MKKQNDIVDKIDLEELIKEFKVLNISSFINYLKDIWRVRLIN
jgi:hypothetical protein